MKFGILFSCLFCLVVCGSAWAFNASNRFAEVSPSNNLANGEVLTCCSIGACSSTDGCCEDDDCCETGGCCEPGGCCETSTCCEPGGVCELLGCCSDGCMSSRKGLAVAEE